MTDPTDEANEPETDESSGLNVKRRDVMKAVGGSAALAGLGSTTAAGQAAGCPDYPDGCTFSREVSFPEGQYCYTITWQGNECGAIVKAGQCCSVVYRNVDSDGNPVSSQEICSSDLEPISDANDPKPCGEYALSPPIYTFTCEDCPGIPPTEVCTYDLTCSVVTETCEEVQVDLGGTGLSSDCSVEATLTFAEDCEPVTMGPYTSPTTVTFSNIQGCCTPELVTFTEVGGTEALASCTINPTDAPCGYDDLQTSLGQTVTCDAVEVCVSGVECETVARLSFEESDCPDLTNTFTSEGCYTFQVSGCCTPDQVTFETPGGTALDSSYSLDITGLANCGYEDVTASLGETCCDSVEVCLSDVECPVTAELVLSGTGCDATNPTLTYTESGCQSFDLTSFDCCCVPESVNFYDQNGDPLELNDLSDGLSGLNCVCDTSTVSDKFDATPTVGDSITVNGVTVTVTGTSEGCFTWEASGGRVVAIDVKGGPDSNLNLYGNCVDDQMLPSCGATSGEACAPPNPNSGKLYGVSNFTVYVCSDPIGGCV